MKIIKNCWDVIGASECIFGAHLFEKSVAKIYVVGGLDVGNEMGKLFFKTDKDGFAGHCLLVFHGVRFFDLSISSYNEEGDKVIWHEPTVVRYEGTAPEPIKEKKAEEYLLGGGLLGFRAYFAATIEAEDFEIHVLGEKEVG
jgi:hypothetical protein